MTQTRSRVWVEVLAVVMTLVIGGLLMYALLPFVTAPDQVLVPPPKAMEPTQTLLVLFVAATAVGAPVTMGIVLALVFKFVSKRVPASSNVAPDIPAVKPKPASRAEAQPAAMSPREARVWKIAATLMVLVIAAAGLVWVGISFAQSYGLIK